MWSDIEKHIEDFSNKVNDIDNLARDQKRSLTEKEALMRVELLTGIKTLRKQLPTGRPLTMENTLYSQGQDRSFSSGEGYGLKSPIQSKDWDSLFGSRGGYDWPDKDTNFFQAVFSGRHHPGLTIRAMSETVPADGGFWVPQETAKRIHAVSLENEIIMPNSYVQPMQSNSIKIPAMSIGAHGVALFGGFTASYTAEAGTINEASPKARSMELNAKKLTGLIRFTSELASDMVGGEQAIINICGKGLAWYRDKAFISGLGGGQPLGILNSPCVVTVAKESGQKKNTIVYENLVKMMAAMFAGSFSNSIWICSQSCIPQLLTLSLAVGIGGSSIPVMSQTDGKFYILTRPVLFTEKTPGLGTKGDILLADLSQYCVGLRSEMRFDTSIHVAFETDELLSRIIERHDGQPLWDTALTLADGTQVSPFVVLADRLV